MGDCFEDMVLQSRLSTFRRKEESEWSFVGAVHQNNQEACHLFLSCYGEMTSGSLSYKARSRQENPWRGAVGRVSPPRQPKQLGSFSVITYKYKHLLDTTERAIKSKHDFLLIESEKSQ